MFSSDIAAQSYIARCGGNSTELPDEWELTSPSCDVPSFPKWKFGTMYKLDERGNKRVWQTGFDGISTWTLNGPITSTNIVTSVVKLASESTLSRQAFITCKKGYLDKYRDGYKLPGDDSERMMKGMKGKEYMGERSKLIFPVVVDTKVDGIRALCSMRDNEVRMMSYGNKSLEHISHIRDHVNDFMAFLPPNTTTDGELYKHGLTLLKIQSLVRSYKNIKEEMCTLEYYVFDISYPADDVIEVRYPMLEKAYVAYRESITYTTSIRVVPKWYAYSHEDIQKSFEKCISEGYEGVVIRCSSVGRKEGSKEWDKAKYSFKRSNAMLKYKMFHTGEAIIMGVKETEGKEKGMCKLVVQLDNGKMMSLRYGTADQKRSWLVCPDTIKGKVIKYEHTGLNNETGIPQRPRAICIRDVSD